MNMYYVSFIVAIGFGAYGSYLFLKASSLYAQYRESVKRRTHGEVIMASWKFIMPFKKYEGESSKMAANRALHNTYINRYYIMIAGMFAMLIISVLSTK